MAAVIESCNYPAKKKQAYLAELERMGAVDGRVLVPHRVKAFIKKETYSDSSKEPRTIQCLPIQARIICMYYLKCINDAFFEN